MTRRGGRVPGAAWIPVLVLLAAAACGRRPPPSADSPPPPAPDLTGATVMVLPVQGRGGADGVAGLDAELAYWLADRGPRIRWVFPPQLEQALARTPGLDIRLDALPVSSFRRAEVRTIGDPLFGDLRRLGALADARFALLPVSAAYVARSDGPGRIEMAAALIDTHGGRVLWFGVTSGEPGAQDDRAVTASAARALAQALVR